MKNQSIKAIVTALLISVGLALPAASGPPFSPPTTFQNQQDGTVIFASLWNTWIGGLYTYITGSLLPQLNSLVNKGDIYVYNGIALTNLAVGGNGQVLTANSGTSTGLQWTTVAGTSPLTTLGDLLTVNSSSAAVRLPVGTNGQVLTADSTQPFGLNWEIGVGSIPSGTIAMFYGPYGGAVPAGWVLCDGTNGTPNMIGMFPLGAQASGGTSTPNSAGFGNSTVGTTYGAISLALPFSVNGNTGSASAGTPIFSGGVVVATGTPNTHFHGFSFTGTTSSGSIQPAAVGLQFIMKI